MKPYLMTAEKALATLDCRQVETRFKVVREPSRTLIGQIGKLLARSMSNRVSQPGRPAATPSLNLNEHHVLHDLFKQEIGLESRLKVPEGARKVVILQKRR